jgi:hypothetical protein
VASELARLTGLGAVVVDKVVLAETSPTPWTRFVPADPEGNQFCAAAPARRSRRPARR